jgi:hypothetical protein
LMQTALSGEPVSPSVGRHRSFPHAPWPGGPGNQVPTGCVAGRCVSYEAGPKPAGVLAVTAGVARLVTGAAGGVVVVAVCWVACGAAGIRKFPDPVTPPSPNPAPSAPMAISALPPITAEPSFQCVAVTLTTPFGR